MGNTCSNTKTTENNIPLQRNYRLVDDCLDNFLLYWGVSLNGHNQKGCVYFYNELNKKNRILLFSIPQSAGEVSSVVFSIENETPKLTFNAMDKEKNMKTFIVSWKSDECLFINRSLTNLSAKTVIFNEDGSMKSVSKVNNHCSNVESIHVDSSSASEDVSPSNGHCIVVSQPYASLAVDQQHSDFQSSMQQSSTSQLSQTFSPNFAGGAVEDVELHQNFPQCGPSPSGTTHFPCVVTQFSGNTTTFSVSDDGRSITYINNDGVIQYVSLGVSKDTIKNIDVYEICSGIYLIMIHATDGFVYVSGYSNRRTAKSLTSICVNNFFSENPKEFKIEFLPPKTADDGSELQNRDFKLLFSSSLSKTFNVNSNGVLNQIPNF